MSAGRKELGRIQSLRIGHGGYQDAQFGVRFDLGGKGWGVMDFWGAWSPELVPHTQHCRWSPESRNAELSEMCARLAALLKEANVTDVQKLVGMPIEITFTDNGTLHEWRLLTEVLP